MPEDILLMPWAQSPVPSDSTYFAALAAARPVAALIAQELEPLTRSGAQALRQCGHFPIGSGLIELVAGLHGMFTRGVKWCGSRYCPTCQPRMMGALAGKRVYRARAAAAAGYGLAFLQVGQPHGGAGELAHLVSSQLNDWRAAYPSPSRSAAFRQAVPAWIGADWSLELDWHADAQVWHVHAHPLAFLQADCSPEILAALVARWPHPQPLAWAEAARSPEAAARYAVKAENENPGILNLFGLARRGMVDQVAEYLQAVQGQRLRQPSAKLTQLLKLSGSGEDDGALMALAEAAPGEVVGRFTPREWRSSW